MQGIITTPNGDVWALDNEKDQIVYLPKGDATKGRILGRTMNGKPADGTLEVKHHSTSPWINRIGSGSPIAALTR